MCHDDVFKTDDKMARWNLFPSVELNERSACREMGNRGLCTKVCIIVVIV